MSVPGDSPDRKPVPKDAPDRKPVPKDAPDRKPVPKDAPDRKPVPKDAPDRKPVPKDAPDRKPVPEDAPDKKPVQKIQESLEPSISISSDFAEKKQLGKRLEGLESKTFCVNSSLGKTHTGIRQESLESQTSFDDEMEPKPEGIIAVEQFLHAVEFGDIHEASQILKDHPEIHRNDSDKLGRTALRLAVKNEHLEIIHMLLTKSSRHQIYEAVLQAISDGHTQIAETILKHQRYLEMWKESKRLGDTDNFYKTAYPDSQFSTDITPLILASQKNQYEIVQLLLLRGEIIMKPHKFSCACQECRNKVQFDQLRLAKYRLNAYRGLASEAYISLSSKDPILTAFKLAYELRRLSRDEKHFKREYRELADQLSDYVVKLLDRIRSQKELELVLNKIGKPSQEKFKNLARFKLALKYKEKKFVAHPSCQQRVVRAWYDGTERLERAHFSVRVPMIFAFILAYPVLVIIHLFFPKKKEAKILQFPIVKFSSDTISFLIFMALILMLSIESYPQIDKSRSLGALYNSTIKQKYDECRMSAELLGPDFPLRDSKPSVTNIFISLWLLGMVYSECCQLYRYGLKIYISLYNAIDFLLLCTCIAWMALRNIVLIKFHTAVRILEENNTEPCHNIHYIYWMNTDRKYWWSADPRNVAESLFALTILMSFFRILYLFQASETLGPLQISLRRMLKDIGRFSMLFICVFFAFMIGLNNLYWHYGSSIGYETDHSRAPMKAQIHFGNLSQTMKTIFWALFQRGDYNAVELNSTYFGFTQNVGYSIYGLFHIIAVTMLFNMLIAMMTRSFTRIAEDVDREWKFARSLLYMDYIEHGSTLPTPLNLLSAFKSIYRFIRKYDKRDNHDEEEDKVLEQSSIVTLLPTFKHEPKEKSLGKIIQSELMSRSLDEKDESSSGSPPTLNIAKHLYLTNVIQQKETLTYQQTMQRIVQRYIFDIQREAEVQEAADTAAEMKRSISRLRYEIDTRQQSFPHVQEELNSHIQKIQGYFRNRASTREEMHEEQLQTKKVQSKILLKPLKKF